MFMIYQSNMYFVRLYMYYGNFNIVHVSLNGDPYFSECWKRSMGYTKY